MKVVLQFEKFHSRSKTQFGNEKALEVIVSSVKL